MKTANIGIIGSGIVGSATGKGLKDLGNNVSFYDIDISKIEDLKKQGLQATTDLESVVKNSEIFFICVPTPDNNRKIDLGIMESAVSELSKECRKKPDYFLLVVKSTVIPTTTENIIIPLIEKYSNKKVGNDLGVCFNPEFLRESNPYEDFKNPDRIVIGEYDKKSGDVLEQLYLPFKCPIIRTNLRTAEMTKYANNCFYATKISFFNEIHLMCKEIGIDSNIIRKVVQMDKFYKNHPWEHGHSFGGKCLPKDLNAIIAFFDQYNIHDPMLLKAVRKVNEDICTLNAAEVESSQQAALHPPEKELFFGNHDFVYKSHRAEDY
ncbi:UDP-glucose 6-dehydrogenase AglM [uncultured archaeon]|nr:UDP-glucose 6-dehydrogenase AglM [uncultured archaeon]